MTEKGENSEMSRSKTLFNQVLQEFSVRHQEFFHLKEESNKLLKVLSGFLLPLAKSKCQSELENSEKYFNLIDHDFYGIHFEKNEFYKNNEKDAKIKLNEIERCIDRYTGINKKINLYEMSSKEIIYKNKICVENCEKKSHELADEILKECFLGCTDNLLENFSNLQTEYNQDLLNIINKF